MERVQEFSLLPRPRSLSHLPVHVRELIRAQGRDMASASRPYRMMRRDPSRMGTELETFGMILLLFETPSGFALFSISGTMFRAPDAVENIWANFADEYKARDVAILRGFQTFDDKSRAINPLTGVHEKLKNMIMSCRRPGQLLAVGKVEYKAIFKTTLEIPCVCCEKVMEVMWGLKNVMRSLVPQEESEMTKEDRLPMSYGLRKFLNCHGFDDVKPEMINEQIIMTASALFHCDTMLQNDFEALVILGDFIKRVFDIDTQDWNLLKLATALKLMFCPEESDYHSMFSEDERSKLVNDADVYVRLINGCTAWQTYKDLLATCEVRHKKSKMLRSLIMEAKELMKSDTEPLNQSHS